MIKIKMENKYSKNLILSSLNYKMINQYNDDYLNAVS